MSDNYLAVFVLKHIALDQAYSPLGPTFNQTAKDILIEGNLTKGIGHAHNKSGAQVVLAFF